MNAEDLADPLEEWIVPHSPLPNLRVPPMVLDQARQIASELTQLLRRSSDQCSSSEFAFWKVSLSGATRFGMADVDRLPVGHGSMIPLWHRDPIGNPRGSREERRRRDEEEGSPIVLRVEFAVRKDYDAIFALLQREEEGDDGDDSVSEKVQRALMEEPPRLSYVAAALEGIARREALLSTAVTLPLVSLSDANNGNKKKNVILSDNHDHELADSPAATQLQKYAAPYCYVVLPTTFLTAVEPTLGCDLTTTATDNNSDDDDAEDERSEPMPPTTMIGMLRTESADHVLEDLVDRYCRVAPPLRPFLHGLFAWCTTHGFLWAPQYQEWKLLPEALQSAPRTAMTGKQASDVATRCLCPRDIFAVGVASMIKAQRLAPIAALVPSSISSTAELQRFLSQRQFGGTDVGDASPATIDVSLYGTASQWLFEICLTGWGRGERAVMSTMQWAESWFQEELGSQVTLESDDAGEPKNLALLDSRLVAADEDLNEGPGLQTGAYQQRFSKQQQKQHTAAHGRNARNPKPPQHLLPNASLRATLSSRAKATAEQYQLRSRTAVAAAKDEKEDIDRTDRDGTEASLVGIVSDLLTNPESILMAHCAKNCSRCGNTVDSRSACAADVLLCRQCQVDCAKQTMKAAARNAQLKRNEDIKTVEMNSSSSEMKHQSNSNNNNNSTKPKETESELIVNVDGICVGCNREVPYLKNKLLEILCNSCRF